MRKGWGRSRHWPHQEAGYTSAVVTVAPDPVSLLQSGGVCPRLRRGLEGKRTTSRKSSRPQSAWATALRPVSLRRGLSRVERGQQAPRSPMPGSRFEVPQDSPHEMVFLLMRPSEAHEEQVDSAVSASQHGLEIIAGARAFNCFLRATGSAGKFCRHRQDHKVSQRSGC